MAEIFQEVEPRFTKFKSYLWMGLALLSVVIGALQTESVVTQLPRPSREEVIKVIEEDEAEERKVGEQYFRDTKKLPPKGVVIHETFSETARQMLAKAYHELRTNDALEASIRRDFGRSFRGVNAVVFPAWEANHHKGVFGFTDIGRQVAVAASREDFGFGFTVHDRHSQPQATVDGVPRVGIDHEAFIDHDTLKLTLFHELLHAMNIPKHGPPFFTLLQNDLVYCDEYRNYLKTYGFKDTRERNIWIGIVFPAGALFHLVVRHLWWVWLKGLWLMRRGRRRPPQNQG